MSRSRPPLLLRLAVVVGAFTLLLGLVGVVLLVLQGDDSASAAGPGLGERVRVVGAEEALGLTVQARWEEGDVLHRELARELSHAAHVYLLPPGLVGRDVVIEVLDDAGDVLASHRHVPRRAEEIRVEVQAAPER